MVAGRVVPSLSLIATSPSSASASSAVTTRPAFQTKPEARERCEWTETMAGAVLATMSETAEEREARVVGSVMARLQRVVSNLGVAPALLNYPDGQENAIWMREDTKKSHAVAGM